MFWGFASSFLESSIGRFRGSRIPFLRNPLMVCGIQIHSGRAPLESLHCYLMLLATAHSASAHFSSAEEDAAPAYQ
jgi:hypothetical protein